MSGYIIAHDLGTSGNKATLYNEEGVLKGSHVHEYPVYYPQDKWVEQDPADWWKAVCVSTRKLLEKTKISEAEVLCVTFSAQMMGCLLVDSSGEPLRKMITWADTRSVVQEKHILETVGMERGYRITGHRLGASYSAAKLLWVKENEPEIYQKAACMLQAKDYIIYKLTGKFVTDYSDASGTNLFDIGKKCWSDELIQAFGIRGDLLPELHPSTDIAGQVTAAAAAQCGLKAGTPVVLGGGDGSCATVGAGAVKEGSIYNALGTSSWIAGASAKPLFDKKWRTFNFVHLDENLYAPCGAMQAAGLSYQWFRNNLGGEERLQAEEQGIPVYELLNQKIAETPPGARGLIYLPYLLGERSPQWNLNARGAFIGLKGATTKAEMARAVLEGVGFNLRIILDAFGESWSADEVIMIGGGAKGRVWLQILADIWQKPLCIPAYIEEATSMGAAVCGGVGIGLYPDFTVCERLNRTVERIEPNQANAPVYQQLYPVFQEAYEQLVPIYDKLSRIQ